MEFFTVRRFGRARKKESEEDPDVGSTHAASQVTKYEILDPAPKATMEVEEEEEKEELEDDDDDDFITNEVKRRLKELRKNSFMVLIPEEGYPEEEEEEEEEESSSSEWRESEVVDGYPWCGFDTLYDKYTERMLFFDKMMAQVLQEADSWNKSKGSARSLSKKLSSTLRSLSFKRRDLFREDCEHLQQQQQQQENDPYQALETAYVAQVSLSWEALHCQYMQLSQKISSQPENSTSYSLVAQSFQQFQVLLQRFSENEPFERGSRVEIYAHARSYLSKLLQVPNFQGSDPKNVEDGMETAILASDLIKVIEDSILTFHLFLKMEKKKTGASPGGHNYTGSSIQQVQASLDKKEMKVKELSKKKKAWKKKTWPTTAEEVELLFGLIDIKVISRVLRMSKLGKEQLLWCEEKMSKLDLSDNKLRRDGSPILFPC
ncbi:uncharacterized protein [Typha angustifolia]|uniref:uncharacterized protein n=1 Tax=Typha angustifolia TaxID=59011 RepID=UPI003C2B1F3C